MCKRVLFAFFSLCTFRLVCRCISIIIGSLTSAVQLTKCATAVSLWGSTTPASHSNSGNERLSKHINTIYVWDLIFVVHLVTIILFVRFFLYKLHLGKFSFNSQKNYLYQCLIEMSTLTSFIIFYEWTTISICSLFFIINNWLVFLSLSLIFHPISFVFIVFFLSQFFLVVVFIFFFGVLFYLFYFIIIYFSRQMQRKIFVKAINKGFVVHLCQCSIL